jgi:hypothetical protein
VVVRAETCRITFWTSPVDEEIIKLIVEELQRVLLWGIKVIKSSHLMRDTLIKLH